MTARDRSQSDSQVAEDSDGRDENKTDPLAEIQAMGKVAEALSLVDGESARRILRWASERFGATAPNVQVTQALSLLPSRAAVQPEEDLGELFARAAPTDGPERALVVGYWLQVVKGMDDLEGQTINSELKNLGHGLPNVTATMSLLMSQQPALVIQTRKIGSAQQGRKRYRLTTAGMTRVRQMLNIGVGQ